jgi:F0F1-type ATP synthase membrane subunit b/b'
MDEQMVIVVFGAVITLIFGATSVAIKQIHDNLANRIKDVATQAETNRVESNASDRTLMARMDNLEKRIADIVEANFLLHRQDSERHERMTSDMAATKATLEHLTRAVESMHCTIEKRGM